MERRYLITLTSGILIFSLLSAWNIWFLAGILACVMGLCYIFYSTRIQDLKDLNDEVREQMDNIREQLEMVRDRELALTAELDVTLKTKRKLLSAMSHEIRTPMNGVMGMSVLLQETGLDKEQQEYISTILSCSKKLLSQVNDILVNDMLDFSKHDTANIELDKAAFNLRNCIEEVLDIFSGKVAAAGLDLLYKIDEDVPAQVTGDNKRLQQVLINLIENAIKFTSEGDIMIAVRMIKNSEGHELLSFEVHDTGTGITAVDPDKLFEGFFANNTNTGNGRGLGLAICRKLVGLMGGNIKAVNRKNGATFSFTIPAKHTMQQEGNLARYTMDGLEGKQILIVEDNIASADLLKEQLEEWKLFTTVAHSAKSALENLSQVKFDLIIIDLNMPVMNGIELTREIKKKYPLTPVILLNPAADERHKKDEEIFSAVISKPVKQHLLFDNVFAELRSHADATASVAATPKLSTDFSKKYPLRIMIAEDNDVNQKWALKILGKLGYTADIAGNGKVVLEIVSHEHYDLILMDVQMPEMDGLEATKMIRVCLEDQPVIIAMTANVMQGDRQDCIQAGMNDYISKPVEIMQLMKMLEKWATLIKDKKQMTILENE